MRRRLLAGDVLIGLCCAGLAAFVIWVWSTDGTPFQLRVLATIGTLAYWTLAGLIWR